MEAVYSFVKSADLDSDLRRALSQVHGSDAIVRLAASRGLHFTAEELKPVVSLLRFLADVSRDSDLREQVAQSATPAAVLELARTRGYSFSESELGHLSIDSDPERELSDGELGQVAGGSGIVEVGLRVQFQTTIARQTPQTDFGVLLKRGLSGASDATLATGQVAAPFIPGAGVLTAAISG
jgi:predicted ribosomally synthesized peptide with nif11-like leader